MDKSTWENNQRHVVSLVRQVINVFWCMFVFQGNCDYSAIITDLSVYFDVFNCNERTFQSGTLLERGEKVGTEDFRDHVKLLFGSEKHRGLVQCLNWVNNLQGTCGPLCSLYDTVTDSCRTRGLISFFLSFFFFKSREPDDLSRETLSN